MTSNNKLYKEIAEIVNDTTYPKYYSSLYFMKQISLHYGNTYTGCCCSAKYLKDIAYSICGVDYGTKINRYYLQKIAEEVSSSADLSGHNDNYYLNIIKNNIGDDRIATTLDLTVSDISVNPLDTITVGGSMTADNNPLVGVNVSIYDGDTLIETVETLNDGSFALTNAYEIATAGVHNINAEYVGDETYRRSSDAVNVNATVISTQLNISSYDSTVEYGDDFDITCTLTDGTNPIANAPVYLWLGNTAVDSDTTNASGQVTFTQSGATVGTHYYQVRYTGSARYTSSNSSNVGVSTVKETTVMTITSPITGTYNTGNQITISGTLVDNDTPSPNPVANVSVVFDDGSSTPVTMTTDSNGAFSGSITYASNGTYTATVSYAGDSNYLASSVSNIVLTIVNESITLTTDGNNILSYADGDSTTLTATLTGATITGQTVQVLDDSDDSVVGTMTDNNDGTYTYTYQSAGVGDIVLKAKWGSYSSSTYNVEDCTDYDPMTSNSGKWNIPSSMASAISYNSNGMTVTGLSGGNSMKLLNTYNTPVIIKFDYVAGSGSSGVVASPQICLDTNVSNNNSIAIRPNGNQVGLANSSGNFNYYNVTSVIGTFKIVFSSSTTYSVYLDDELVGTESSANISSTNFILLSSTSRSFTIKNVRIKPVQ